ncbi:V-type immunoglobulin domain-containing suppressor of T-cell activation [Anabarilius grahami]|nr:V-type immunoglobulin domain-containing suppressor of T-cell activation [Anabarilius grahami]
MGYNSVFVGTSVLKIYASGEHHSLSVSVPHRIYECPEGANVTLTCIQSGSRANLDDKLFNTWLFTPRSQERCHKGEHPRGSVHTNHSMGVEYIPGKKFSIFLQNIKHKDQGKYCCLLVDFNNRHKVEQEAHEFIYLTVVPSMAHIRDGSLKCLEWSHSPSDGSHELVRMDSEAQGHENPVFLGESPQPKTRTVSQIMRQSSETGRHLLSEPGTPFSPNIQGELVFFPAHDPIPESPNLLE